MRFIDLTFRTMEPDNGPGRSGIGKNQEPIDASLTRRDCAIIAGSRESVTLCCDPAHASAGHCPE